VNRLKDLNLFSANGNLLLASRLSHMRTEQQYNEALIMCSPGATPSWLTPTIKSQGLNLSQCHSRSSYSSMVANKRYRLVLWYCAQELIDVRDFCRATREIDKNAIAIVIDQRHDETDHISCLELGVSDYLTTSYSEQELKARLRAHLFRSESLFQRVQYQQQAENIICRGLCINLDKHEVSFMGENIDLTVKEFELLKALISRPGQVFTREQLLNNVWGQNADHYAHTVSTHINRLRGKLEAISTEVKLIHTLWGVGYKFCDCYEPPIEKTG